MKTLLLLTAAIAVLASGPLQAQTQTWPARSVRIIVPFAPGSTPDSLGRILADRLQSRLNVPFVVENKPGASGNTGTDAVAEAEPDGTTIGLSIVGPLALNKLLFKTLPYDPVVEILAEPAVREKLAALFMEPVSNTAEEFRAVIRQELDR